MWLLLLVVVVVAAAAEVPAAQVPLVHTEGGRLSGIVEVSMKGRDIFAFYGIPFARPPVGKLRFKNPEPPPAWAGTRDASVPAEVCIQNTVISDFKGKINLVGQEDCLYLNVFTTRLGEEKIMPVMVFIHGGAFLAGSAKEYSSRVLLDHDVVLVVVQYRLGVLGFMSTEDSVMPGNLGLKDQTMALEWVQRNIHLFGGDKTRVTIFGESAGAASVHFQMLTPKAEGLFSRAILQSGTALCPWALNNNPRKWALMVADALGCPTDEGSDSLLGCLQEVDADILVPLCQVSRKWFILPQKFVPWTDGHYLPEHAAQLVLEGRHAKVDIMSGVTREEGALAILPALWRQELLQQLNDNFSVTGPASLQFPEMSDDPVAVARQVYLHYLGTTEVTETHADGLVRMLGNHHVGLPHDLTTAFHAHHLHPAKKTFRYELQHKAELSLGHHLCPSCRRDWVCHGDELFYLFRGGANRTVLNENLIRTSDLQRPDDLALRDIITTLWTNFAATGNPTPDASLGFTWEPSTADNLQFLSLTPLPAMEPDNRKEARKLHNSLPLQVNFILHPNVVGGSPSERTDAKYSSKTEL